MAEKTPKDGGGYGWIVVFATFGIMFMIDGVLNSFGLLLVGLMEELQGSTVSVAAAGGIFLGFVAFSAPFAGSLSDAFGRRYVALAGAIFFSSGLLGSAFVSNIALLYFTYGILGGSGYGLMFTCSQACVIEHFRGRKRGIASGLALCGSGFGSFVLSLTTKYLLDAYSSRGTFLLLSGIMLNGIPCALLLRQPLRTPGTGGEHSLAVQDNPPEATNEDHQAVSTEGRYAGCSIKEKIEYHHSGYINEAIEYRSENIDLSVSDSTNETLSDSINETAFNCLPDSVKEPIKHHPSIYIKETTKDRPSDSTKEAIEHRSSPPIKESLKTLFVKTLLVNNLAIFRDFQCFCFLVATFAFGLAYFVPYAFLPKQAIAMDMGKDKAAWL